MSITLGVLIFFISFAVYAFMYYKSNGRLPLPYYDDSADSLMDFYNVSFWALNEEKYSVWGSTYPPFAFFISNFLAPTNCLAADSPIDMRALGIFNCGYIYHVIFYVGAVFLTPLIFFKELPKTKSGVITYIAGVLIILLSFPSVFALDRGNLIIDAYAFLVFAIIFFKNKLISIPFFSAAVLVKPYLIFLFAAYVKDSFVKSVLYFGLSLCFISILTLNELDYTATFSWVPNLLNFYKSDPRSLYEVASNATSITTYAFILNDPRIASYLSIHIPIVYLYYVSLALAYCYIVRLFVYMLKNINKLSAEKTFALVFVFIMLVFNSFGLYTLILSVPIFLLLFKTISSSYSLQKWLILFVYLLLMSPIPIPIGPERILSGQSFYSNVVYNGGYSLPISGLMRPILLVFLVEILIAIFNKAPVTENVLISKKQ